MSRPFVFVNYFNVPRCKILPHQMGLGFGARALALLALSPAATRKKADAAYSQLYELGCGLQPENGNRRGLQPAEGIYGGVGGHFHPPL